MVITLEMLVMMLMLMVMVVVMMMVMMANYTIILMPLVTGIAVHIPMLPLFMIVLFYLARPERVLRQGATAAPAFEDVTSQPRWAVATWTTLEFRSDGNAAATAMAALAMRKYSRVALAAKGSKKPMLRNMEAPETADAVREELAMKLKQESVECVNCTVLVKLGAAVEETVHAGAAEHVMTENMCDGCPIIPSRQYLTLLVQSYDFYLEERKKGAKRVRGGEKGQRFFSTRNRKFWDFVNWRVWLDGLVVMGRSPRTYFRRQWEKKAFHSMHSLLLIITTNPYWDFLYALFFGYCDAASVVTLRACFAPFYFTWKAFACFLVGYVITGMLGITLSYHRQLAHLSFKSPKIVEYFLAYCGSLAVQSHPINWVPRCPLIDIITAPLHLGIAVTVGQDTANDVHSPKDGFWWSHAGWLLDQKAGVGQIDFEATRAMSISVRVGLMSGRAVWISCKGNCTVGELRLQAQNALQTGSGRLVNTALEVLREEATLDQAGIKTGEDLLLHFRQLSLASTERGFAALLSDGSVVTWGHADDGGDSSSVKDQLRTVQQIQSTNRAFAAILADGAVATWGHAGCGGDSSSVKELLKDVQHIEATHEAFAAILSDRSVVTWGSAGWGGDSSSVQDQLKAVHQIEATIGAFAAILYDGSVATWGHAGWGGDSGCVQDRLGAVQQIQATNYAFAAVLSDGSVATWGHAGCGGDSSSVKAQLKDVQHIEATIGAFAAILSDGSVVTWGHAGWGGDCRCVQEQLKNVQQVQATNRAFAAILTDGSVVTWGHVGWGGDSRAVQDQLKGVQHIQATNRAFAAILNTGSIVTWGDSTLCSYSNSVQEKLKDVQHVQASSRAFAAILSDGSIISWGGDARREGEALQTAGAEGGGVFWGFFARTVWTWHVTWAVNSVSHVWGFQDWNTGDISMNNWLVGILAFGEGWHNNHHAFETSCRHGLKWWQIDMTWYTIKALEFFGLAWDLKYPRLGSYRFER
ncbi:ADS3 [Symbiodinium sp. KB8]|nr:ADS3 [Symbiodinium sp. KB8]